MKYKGIAYDIGTEYRPGEFSRSNLNENIIKADISVIRNKLNCNSIRIYGKDIQLLLTASEIALQNELNVWISPRLINENELDTLKYLKLIAQKCEILKNKYKLSELVFIVGGELTIDMNGFVAGSTIHERIANLLKPAFFLKSALGITPKYQKAFSNFLENAYNTVKNEFSGKITYAAAVWETVDWKIFDFVSVNFYKASFNSFTYEKKLKKLLSLGKPVAITEFGCCSYNGADKKGPMGYFVLDTTVKQPVFKENCIRNETVQSNYIIDLLKLYKKSNITGAFVFEFYSQNYIYNSNPNFDFDKASFGVTKSLGDNKWEPKDSFLRIAEYFKEN